MKDIKLVSKRKIKKTLDTIFKVNSDHFLTDKWDLSYVIILEEIINDLLEIDISEEILSSLRSNCIYDVSFQNKKDDIFKGAVVLRSNSYNPSIYYNVDNNEFDIFDYSISFSPNKNSLIYIGEL